MCLKQVVQLLESLNSTNASASAKAPLIVAIDLAEVYGDPTNAGKGDRQRFLTDFLSDCAERFEELPASEKRIAMESKMRVQRLLFS